MHRVGIECLLGIALIASGMLEAQEVKVAGATTLTAVNAAANPLMPGLLATPAANSMPDFRSCDAFDIQAVPELSWKQRTCLYRARLLSKSFPIRAALFSAVSELRKNDIKNPGIEDFTHRVATYYARRTAQSTGELLAGYLNHEDPRYHPSMEHGVWRRTRSALLSVMVMKDIDGGSRMAFAPIAGAFGSGMVSVACYRYHNSFDDGLRRSATAYSFYFGTAILREFRPELTGLMPRFLQRR